MGTSANFCQYSMAKKDILFRIQFILYVVVKLAIEAGVGIAVFVCCFVNKGSMEAEIIDRLGNGFSRAPFATSVAVCTVVSMLACVPLGELFFFHMILIRKGITTYEFVVAIRTMSEAPQEASVDENCQTYYTDLALSQLRYISDCKELFVRLLGNLHVVSSGKGYSKKKTGEIWGEMYPEVPYDLDFTETVVEDT